MGAAPNALRYTSEWTCDLHVHDSCVQPGRNSRNKFALETQRRLDVLNEIQELIARNGAEAVLRTIQQNIHVRDLDAHVQYQCSPLK